MKTKEEILKMKKEKLKTEWKKLNCTDCTDCKYCTNCTYCTDCMYCTNCTDCKYMILNVQLTKEEYEKKIKEINN